MRVREIHLTRPDELSRHSDVRSIFRLLASFRRDRAPEAPSCAVVLRHEPTGSYVAPGGWLADGVEGANVFTSAEEATAFVSRYGCEPAALVVTALELPTVEQPVVAMTAA